MEEEAGLAGQPRRPREGIGLSAVDPRHTPLQVDDEDIPFEEWLENKVCFPRPLATVIVHFLFLTPAGRVRSSRGGGGATDIDCSDVANDARSRTTR